MQIIVVWSPSSCQTETSGARQLKAVQDLTDTARSLERSLQTDRTARTRSQLFQHRPYKRMRR